MSPSSSGCRKRSRWRGRGVLDEDLHVAAVGRLAVERVGGGDRRAAHLLAQRAVLLVGQARAVLLVAAGTGSTALRPSRGPRSSTRICGNAVFTSTSRSSASLDLALVRVDVLLHEVAQALEQRLAAIGRLEVHVRDPNSAPCGATTAQSASGRLERRACPSTCATRSARVRGGRRRRRGLDLRPQARRRRNSRWTSSKARCGSAGSSSATRATTKPTTVWPRGISARDVERRRAAWLAEPTTT